MACSLFGNAALSGASRLVCTRGYAAAAVRGGVRVAEEKYFVGMRREAAAGEVSVSSSWVPDPVTGYYRPGNCSGEIDAAELREMLLSRGGCRN